MTTDSVDGPVLRASAEQEYARYLVRFLRAYAADGVPVDALTPQNEPLYVPEDMPGVLMSARQEARFVGTALGPALAQAGLRTAILVYDHNWDRPDYPAAVLADPVARRYVSGAAFHCYAGDVAAQSAVHGRFPDQDVYLTECSGVRSADPAATFGDTLDWQTEKLVIGATRNWARAVFTWNVALDPDGGPTIGPCATCTGVLTVDNRAGTVTYNAEYYVLGHASRFVAPGAVRVDSTSLGPGDVQDVAFRNPDGSIVLVALNTASTASTFTVSCGGRAFRYTLPPGAVATFRW
jgi:glucosylceramidase